MPLEDENRILVSLGLKAIAGRKREGMRALLRVSGDPDPVDSDVLGYRLGPRLNAAGRLDDAGKGVRLMMTEDPAEADRLAEELDALNTERRAAEQRLVKAAQAQAAGHDFIGEKALIVRGRDWHVGVIGLAAGRLCQQYYCPTCVLSEHEGLLHGSLRSIPGVHIHECLKTCDDLLLRYGGHEQAAGVTLEADRYEAFCERLQSAVGRAEESCFVPAQPYDAELTLSDCTDAVSYTHLDVYKRQELLKSAGYEFDANNMLSASTPISFEYLTNEGSGNVGIAECIQQDLAVIGINMTIRKMCIRDRSRPCGLVFAPRGNELNFAARKALRRAFGRDSSGCSDMSSSVYCLQS